MNYVSKLSAVAVGLAFLACTLLAACDTQVYTDQELEAQERFKAVDVGAAEQDVRARLGTPSGVAARSGSDELSFESAHEGANNRTLSLDANDRSKWPEDLQFLPKRSVSGKVLVYVDGTVTAYYFVSPDGRVEYVELFTS